MSPEKTKPLPADADVEETLAAEKVLVKRVAVPKEDMNDPEVQQAARKIIDRTGKGMLEMLSGSADDE